MKSGHILFFFFFFSLVAFNCLPLNLALKNRFSLLGRSKSLSVLPSPSHQMFNLAKWACQVS